MTAHKILICNTDMGAANHGVHLTRLLGEDPRFEVVLYAAPPASKMFEQHDARFYELPQMPVIDTRPTTAQLAALVNTAARMIGKHDPSVVVVGLSNARYGYGYNEAFVAAAHRDFPRSRSVTMLDDRGPLDPIDGRYSDYLLATSPAILDWARRTIGHPNVVLTGSLKHHALSLLPSDRMRQDMRQRLGLDEGERLVTFVAQSDEMAGHNDCFLNLLDCLGRAMSGLPGVRILIRMHPGAPSTGAWCCEQAEKRGFRAIPDIDSDITWVLAASDVLLSCNSGAMVDYLWLSLNAQLLNAIPIYLVNEQLKRWLIQMTGVWRPDLVERGLACVAEPNQLEPMLWQAMRGQLRAPNNDRNSLRDRVDSPFVSTLETLDCIAHGHIEKMSSAMTKTYGLQ